MLKAAIVGLGWWGQVLARSVHGKSDRIRLTRGVTRTPARAAEFSLETGIPVDADYASALADPEIDAVVLATPHSQHVDQIVAAAAAGKHVFVEKPLALSVREACRAIEACERANVVLAVGHNRRFLPAYERLARMVSDGTLGKPMHVEGNFSGPSGYRRAARSWRLEPGESPLGGMTGRGMHVTDLMIALFGPVSQVYARSARLVLTSELDDTTAMLLSFECGMSGTLTTLTATADIWRLQVYGSKGWAEMRGEKRLAVRIIGEDELVSELPDHDVERAELERFADAVSGRADYPVSRDEIVHNIALLESIGRSAELGRPVPIDSAEDEKG
jgi:predicted dehydrogenase